MEKRKFKVGERYKSRMILDNAALIEITEINGDFVSYKDVERETSGRKMFEIGSIFSDNLEKVGSETIVIYRNDNKVVALDKSTGEKAEAKCNPADEFDFRTGAKLAFNRLMGEDAKPDDGEVKRKAKIGEYVKVVNAKPAIPSYKNGDIFKVTYVTTSGCICKNSDGDTGLWHEEYVVLENYKPEKKDEICVGDTVKVTDSGKQYRTYGKWSGLNGYKQNFIYGSAVSTEDNYKVLRIEKHDDCYRNIHDKTLALIQNPKTTQVFIINIKGLKKVER